MTAPSESAYRAARRAFIAAAEAAHVDTIARLHPARDAEGKPLFTDSAALGPRLATRGVLAIASDMAGSALAVELLKSDLAFPADARLVLINAWDPAVFVGVQADPTWPATTLTAVTTEDLSRVQELGLVPLDQVAASLLVLALATAGVPCTIRIQWTPQTLEDAKDIFRGLFEG